MSILDKKEQRGTHYAEGYRGKLLCAETPFAVAESFRTLRTNLMYTCGNEKCPVYATASSFPNTGKSLMAANLAIAFSMLKKKVLLIDGDMRKPVQHSCFGVKKENGFSELLSGQIDIDSAVREVKNYPGLCLITSGNIPPNPQELLADSNTAKIIDTLKERFDVIVVDLPPAGVVADAMAISSIVNGYIFVVRSGDSEIPAAQQTIATMKQMNCNVLGVVLNGVNIKTGDHKTGKRKYAYYRHSEAEE